MAELTTYRYETPDQAEAAFYAAFERSDSKAMMAVWSETSDIVCIHPHGPRLVGPTQVEESWTQIMRNSPSMRFRVVALNQVVSPEIAVHYVNEQIFVGGEAEPDFTVMATNIYQRTDDGWRMILHHASPTPESLRQMRQRAEEQEADPERDRKNVTVH